jgi:hypothetical protein
MVLAPAEPVQALVLVRRHGNDHVDVGTATVVGERCDGREEKEREPGPAEHSHPKLRLRPATHKQPRTPLTLRSDSVKRGFRGVAPLSVA